MIALSERNTGGPIKHIPPIRKPEVQTDKWRTVQIDYTNWKNNRRWRHIQPLGMDYRSDVYHLKSQWMVTALDLEADEAPRVRFFPLAHIHAWVPVESTSKEQEPMYNLDKMDKD